MTYMVFGVIALTGFCRPLLILLYLQDILFENRKFSVTGFYTPEHSTCKFWTTRFFKEYRIYTQYDDFCI